MLVLSRKANEAVLITVPASAVPRQIRVVVVEFRGDKLRCGFQADRDIVIHREEIQRLIDQKEVTDG